jgi:hypothetical protein
LDSRFVWEHCLAAVPLCWTVASVEPDVHRMVAAELPLGGCIAPITRREDDDGPSIELKRESIFCILLPPTMLWPKSCATRAVVSDGRSAERHETKYLREKCDVLRAEQQARSDARAVARTTCDLHATSHPNWDNNNRTCFQGLSSHRDCRKPRVPPLFRDSRWCLCRRAVSG